MGKLFKTAAVVAGLGAAIAKLEKKAKNDGTDLKTAFNDTVDKVSDSVKSGQFKKDVSDKLNEILEDGKSGKLMQDIKNAANDIAQGAKDGSLQKNISETAGDLYSNFVDGVNEILGSKDNNNEE